MKDTTKAGIVEELGVLDRLKAEVADLPPRSDFSAHDHRVADALARMDSAGRQARRELARHAYGRVLKTQEVDEQGKRLKSTPTFRITQANISNLSCDIIARNSPIASAIISARSGETKDAFVPRGYRYFHILETRDLYQVSGVTNAADETNFQRGEFGVKGSKELDVVINLRRSIAPPSLRKLPEIKPAPAVAKQPAGPNQLMLWPTSWAEIALEDVEHSSLSGKFFVRTTGPQEKALSEPRGIVTIEGVAGSGKTSVALGRIKFLANFVTGEHIKDHKLEGVSAAAFDPANMLGFVLAPSLIRYLEDTCKSLDIAQLPVKDFPGYLRELTTQLKLGSAFTKAKAMAPSVVGRMSWLRLLDFAIARQVASHISQVANAAVRDDHGAEMQKQFRWLGRELSDEGKPGSDSPLRLEGICERVLAIIGDAVMARELEKFGVANARLQPKELAAGLEKLEQEIRARVPPGAKKLLSDIHPITLLRLVLNSEEFPTLASAVATNAAEREEFLEARNQFLSRQRDAAKPVLTEADLANVIALVATMSSGIRKLGPDNAQPPFVDIANKSGVFIDEMQDFTEVQLHLMSRKANRELSQITVVGDFGQQLQAGLQGNPLVCFPQVPGSVLRRSVPLAENMRQTADLAALSALVRRRIVGDAKATVPAAWQAYRHQVRAFASKDTLSRWAASQMADLPREASIAVICSERDRAEWVMHLLGHLEAANWDVQASSRDELRAKCLVHVTTPLDVKGLEFDVVVIPSISDLFSSEERGANALYVAVSRPRYGLLLSNWGASKLPAPLSTVFDLIPSA